MLVLLSMILFDVDGLKIFHISKLFHLTARSSIPTRISACVLVLDGVIPHLGSLVPILNCLSDLFLFLGERQAGLFIVALAFDYFVAGTALCEITLSR